MRSGSRVLGSAVVLAAWTLLFLAGCGPAQSAGRQDLSAPASETSVVEEPSVQAAGSASAVIFTEAERILGNVKTTHYQHDLSFDETSGTYLCDCSGLVDYVLGRVEPDSFAKIQAHAKAKHPKESRPLAQDYYEYFTEQPSADSAEAGKWRKVERLTGAVAGDVIAYKYTKKADKPDTGHVMIIAGTPKPVDGRYWKHPTWTQYEVRVIDSAISGHHDDKRTKRNNGVGSGYMYYFADSSGAPVAFRWSKPDGTIEYDELLGIAIGRAGE